LYLSFVDDFVFANRGALGNQMKITIVYDNEVLGKGLTAGWGFSCLIDNDVLFDTGGDGVALLNNMRELGIDSNGIKSVVLSHRHGNHTGDY
jgi:7,8-dihydropterin-6-yl-methyl-4-(beta-D-ribofuranosyl)aminobenzene 5'-phosphate synthase